MTILSPGLVADMSISSRRPVRFFAKRNSAMRPEVNTHERAGPADALRECRT